MLVNYASLFACFLIGTLAPHKPRHTLGKHGVCNPYQEMIVICACGSSFPEGANLVHEPR